LGDTAMQNKGFMGGQKPGVLIAGATVKHWRD
jgi:hypothetical protein